jgi:hypothetical protein
MQQWLAYSTNQSYGHFVTIDSSLRQLADSPVAALPSLASTKTQSGSTRKVPGAGCHLFPVNQ